MFGCPEEPGWGFCRNVKASGSLMGTIQSVRLPLLEVSVPDQNMQSGEGQVLPEGIAGEQG